MEESIRQNPNITGDCEIALWMQESRIKQDLFDYAMKGRWDVVEDIYKENPWARTVSITPAGDTALHLAILDGQEDTVEKLVGHIEGTTNDDHLVALKKANNQGNTPLHLAAKVGSARMCHWIADRENALADRRNEDGENPIFTAVLHGKTNAYRALVCLPGCRKYGTSRKTGGDTILHAAISGEYFDLALQIIDHYRHLINYVNERGEFPLHVLATKPSAFRSGNHLNWFNKIIYNCIWVEKSPTPPIAMESAQKKRDEHYFPKNYQTCFMLPKLMIPAKSSDRQKDIKDPKTNISLVAKSSNRQEDIEAKTNTSPAGPHPLNWNVIFEYIKLTYKVMLVILGKGSRDIEKMEEKKKKHTWSIQIIEELLKDPDPSSHNPDPDPDPSSHDLQSQYAGAMLQERGKPSKESPFSFKEPVQEGTETPILIAAKNGITEIIKRLLDKFPGAIHDTDAEEKNIVHLAVEHRQPHVFNLLLMKRDTFKEVAFGNLDKNGNSALHLAARVRDYRAWNIPGEALQLQWELKWYQYVKFSMPLHFFARYNKEGKTPKDIFSESHKDQIKEGREWLNHTSNSCSVVAALIATVAFATSATFPGGVNDNNGRPTLEHQPAFNIFAISSLVALCSSVTALVMFLAILTSRHQVKDFRRNTPRMLLMGLTSLFVSIAAVLLSFCAGHFFVLEDNLRFAAIPVYAVTCLPVTLFAMAQFPLYFDLLTSTFRVVPLRSAKPVP